VHLAVIMAVVAGVVALVQRKIAGSVRSLLLGQPWVHRSLDHVRTHRLRWRRAPTGQALACP